MSAVDGELRRLAQGRIKDEILAMAQFRVTAPPLRGGVGFGIILAVGLMAADWFHRRRSSHLPNPAYLALTESAVYVFSARFGGATKIIGPTQQWKRADIRVHHSDDKRFVLLIQLGADRPIIEIEAAEPGPEPAEIIRLLCGDPI